MKGQRPKNPLAFKQYNPTNFVSLEKYALSRPDPIENASGRQELCENIVNELMMSA
jgi:xylose isomerase